MLTQRKSAVMAELARKPLSLRRNEVAESPRPHPVAPAEPRAKERPTAADNVRKLRRRQRVRWGLFALLPIALLLGGYFYVTGGQVMSTDDAYVQAERVGISTDVSGIVQDVDVRTISASKPASFSIGSTRGNFRSPSTMPRPISPRSHCP